MFDFDPSRSPPEPRDAATVVVARDGATGLELFCVRRHPRSGFLGGAVVFPGGKVDESDRHPIWEARTTKLTERALSLGSANVPARALAVAALRESLEEAAILAVAGGPFDGVAAERLRRELKDAQTGLPSLAWALEQRDLRLDLTRLYALARWVTPIAEKRRYDTRFYLLPAPPGQEGRHDEHETTLSFWATPAQILERWEAGKIHLAPPTSRTVEILSEVQTVADAIGLAAAQSLRPLCPHFIQDGQETVLTLPGDPLHPEPSDPKSSDSAPTRFVLRDGRFLAVRADQRPSR